MEIAENIIAANEQFLSTHAADLQASIFASHRKEHVLMLFLQLENGADTTLFRQMLTGIAENSESRTPAYVTTVQNQQDLYGTELEPDSLFLNCYFTADGLRKLRPVGMAWEEIMDHLEAEKQDLLHYDSSIWDAGYHHAIDAVLLLAHQSADHLMRVQRLLESQYFPRMRLRCLFAETGNVLREPADEGRSVVVEHFGYADGASNPIVRSWEFDKFRRGESSMHRWNPVVPCERFLVKEPASDDQQHYGSYLVYRKFEQHLDRFHEAVERLATQLNVSPETAGAMAFGRRKNGTSLETGPALSDPDNPNDFFYAMEGKCPAFAHIRKVNPRAAAVPDQLPRGFLSPNPILRRGVTFGKRSMRYGRLIPGEIPSDPVGLLFMSFQRGIDQYQAMLEDARQGAPDPLLGDLDSRSFPISLEIPGLSEPFQGFSSFASLRGGVNLYAPSLHFLKQLSSSIS